VENNLANYARRKSFEIVLYQRYSTLNQICAFILVTKIPQEESYAGKYKCDAQLRSVLQELTSPRCSPPCGIALVWMPAVFLLLAENK